MKKTVFTLMFGCLSMMSWGAPSILDIKHSITDDNVVAPESFETKSRELEENFYLQKYAQRAEVSDNATLGTPKEYEELLSRLPAEIEMPYNSIVGKFIEMYLGRRRDLVADMIALHNYYGNIFVEELIKENLPLELQYLPVIESALNPNAVSRAGACGLWQFMPATATGLGMEMNSLVDQRRDPRIASRSAAKLLKQYHDIYDDWSLAIAAYNCGPGNVNKALRRAGGGKKDFWEIYTYLPTETRGYVPAFIAANFVMNYYNRYGIHPTLVKQQLVTDSVQVNQRIHFNQISEVLNIPVDEIRMLNPQFRKDIIPGDNHPYALVLPSQQCLSYIMSEQSILAQDAEAYARRTYVEPGEQSSLSGDDNIASSAQQTQNADDNTDISQPINKVSTVSHTVKRGENLRDIAKKYGVSATDLKRWNNLRRGKVKEGDVLRIETVERVKPETPLMASRTTQETQPAAQPAQTVAPGNESETKTAPARTTASTQKKASTQPAAKTATTYKVKKGDTLGSIAARHGVTVKAIQQANGMSQNNTRININQSLKIPAPVKSAAKTSTKSKRKRR